jgi:hypothetical protein
MRPLDIAVGVIVGILSLYLLIISGMCLIFAGAAFVLAGLMSALMCFTVAVPRLLIDNSPSTIIHDWQTYLLPAKIFFTYLGVLLMSVALVAAPFAVFVATIKKRYWTLAVVSVICGFMQLLTNDLLASHPDYAKGKDAYAAAVNLYPFVKASGYIYFSLFAFSILNLTFQKIKIPTSRCT